MNQKILLVGAGIVVLTAVGWLVQSGGFTSYQQSKTSSNETLPDPSVSTMMMEERMAKDTAELDSSESQSDLFEYTHRGQLLDVTSGETIRGITTNGQASGEAALGFNDTFMMRATFADLPDPQSDDFYEGWLVRRDPFHFISTGVVEKIDDRYVDTYTSSTDFSDHDFYVLTLEPNDGDPAPADHIVEGALVQ